MAENNKKATEQARDYRDRFEFRLTVGDNIICQRYFKIGNFNPASFHAFELGDTIRNCGRMINSDLLGKTQVYLEIYAPRIFEDEEEMERYFADERHAQEMTIGEGIVLRKGNKNYVWGKKGCPIPAQFKFDDGEFSDGLTDDDRVLYKFAFIDNGKDWEQKMEHREVCTYVWEGVYPKFVRNQIDLSNKKKFTEEDLSRLSFEQYLLYKMTEGRTDLVYKIIKDICYTCSATDDSWYTIADGYKNPAKENKTVKE